MTTSAVLLLPHPSCAFSIDNKACACSSHSFSPSFAFTFWVWWWGCKAGLFYEQPLGHVPIPQNRNGEMAKYINGAGKFIRENTAFWTILRGGVCVQVCRAAVCLEFALGRLSVRNAHASWLAQMGCGILIGQRENRSIARIQGQTDLLAKLLQGFQHYNS